jgi:hypothetical protein
MSRRSAHQMLAASLTIASFSNAIAEEAGDVPIDIEKGKQFWSFQPLGNQAPPGIRRLQHTDWVRSPVDRFILARLEEKEIAPPADADPSQLIRRANFDLIGLPPPPDDVGEFERESLSDLGVAFQTLTDRLLESEHYGERWARHWLDIARFAESNGFEMDEDRPHAWRYRDFVIRAINEDMPYDQFVRWQIAGDLIAPDDPNARIATGFLVAGVENVIQTEKDFERDRYDKLDDMTSTVGTALLGLSIGCARCHDHKYDPIPQRDYYRLVSAFGKTVSADVLLGEAEESPKTYAAIDLSGDLTKLHNKRFIVGTNKENFVLKSNVYFLERGNWKQKQGVASQGFPQVLMRCDESEQKEQRWTKNGAGEEIPSRVALANWITDVEHGGGNLLARVMVNRLWQHHMGEGLVSTPSDFGSRGSRPTHPELLDWLARRLVESGWRLKPIHRLIMNSAVYMQGHGIHVSTPKIDPENRLLWHRPLRRLEAEAIRDAMLAVSGTLDTRMFGASTLDKGQSRRSIYLTVKRSQLIPILQLFDAPDALQGIDRRPRTTVAPQALHLLNNPRVREYAAGFADRIDSDGTREISEVIHRGYFTALSRPPTQQEEEAMMALIEGQSKKYLGAGEADAYRRFAITDFCQTLICTNEFIYVE